MCLRLLKPLVLLALTVPLLAQAASQSIPLGARPLALEEDITLEPEERAWLAQRGELRLAIADDLPPSTSRPAAATSRASPPTSPACCRASCRCPSVSNATPVGAQPCVQ